MRVFATLAAASVFVSQALATPPPVHHDFADEVDKPTIIEASFDQLIDHNNPDLGTFPQRYWYNAGWWNGEGSPVIFFTPGEENADDYLGYLTETTTTGKMADQNGGAAVLMEHRYWGKSSPYQNLTSETLQYLNVEQAIADATYFAKTVDLPFDSNHSSNADNAPWVFAGGSYSGALAAWTESTSPGTFWAYAASSAPVEAIYNYWRYFAPVVEGMPTNCSKDINRVVNFLDLIHKSHNPWMQQEIKEMFGLEDLEHFDDVGDAIEYGPWLWQSNTFTTGYSKFFQFCDAVENVQPGAEHVPGPEGVGLWRALEGYSHWFKTKYLPGSCADYGYWTDENTVACYDTYNASNPFFSDTSPSNSFDRTWWWFCCNEPLFFWQDAAPRGDLTLVARMVNAEYFQRQCSLLFPEVNGYTYGSAKGKTAEDVNRWTRGWSDRPSKRLLYVNGQYDPWRESGVSASERPGGPMQSTPETPVFVVPGGFHCTNMLTASGTANEGTQKVIDAELAQIKTWVEEYYQGKK